MDILSIITGAFNLLGQIIGSKDSKVQANTELQKQAQIAQQALVEIEKQIKMKELDIESIVIENQSAINKIEAASDDKYQSRWRPTIGWICAAGLGYTYIIRPFIIAGLAIAIALGGPLAPITSAIAALPVLDIGALMGLVIPLLGLGAYRTYEKVKGTK